MPLGMVRFDGESSGFGVSLDDLGGGGDGLGAARGVEVADEEDVLVIVR